MTKTKEPNKKRSKKNDETKFAIKGTLDEVVKAAFIKKPTKKEK